MGATKITIVRHGETKWNVAMKLQGHQDSALTKNGIRQAEQVSHALKDRRFDVIYSSDLNRALKTAQTINTHFNLEIKSDPNLRERAFGVMEGLTREEIAEKYPDLFHIYMHRNSIEPVPGGESLIEFSERVIKAIETIVSVNSEKEILVVAHGGVLDCIIRKIFNMQPHERRSFTLQNSSINKISIENGKWILQEWGNIDHLNSNSVLNEIN
ncbi:MAG TPA: histidine phosphatase family protein [Bacteroidales bacterium]|jgi:probable phosphoglycerate mutase|nr:histidine phosphatase family protein [Bacteroidales bacterium]